MNTGLEKARSVKQANDNARKKEVVKKVSAVNKILNESKTTVTAACRSVGLAVDKYYRHRDNT
tara:strand:- start:443 stop:631 length:189 start_codon:yes stop_codon:yes gene_type:complete